MTKFPRDQLGEIKDVLRCSGSWTQWPAREEEEGFCAVTLVWRTCQDSPNQSEYVLPSPDYSSPNSAGKLELAAKWPLLAAGPGPGWWWHHMPVAVTPLSSCCAKHWSLLALFWREEVVSPQLAWLFEQNSPAGVLILWTDGTLDTCSASLHPPPPLLFIPSLTCSRGGGESSDLFLRPDLPFRNRMA